MRALLNLKTLTKLSLGFGICIAFSVIIGLVAISNIQKGADGLREMQSRTVVGLRTLNSMSTAIQRIRVRQYRLLVSVSEKERPKLLKGEEEQVKIVEDNLKAYDAAIQDSKRREMFDGIKTAWEDFHGIADQQHALNIMHNTPLEMEANSKKTSPVFLGLTEKLTKLVEYEEAQSKITADKLAKVFESGKQTIAGFMLLTTAFGLATALAISRYLTRSIHNVRNQLNAMADGGIKGLCDVLEQFKQGDLTGETHVVSEPLPVTTTDEIGQMYESCNLIRERCGQSIVAFMDAQETLRDMILHFQKSAEVLGSTSADLANATQQAGNASDEVAAGSERLAASSQEAASVANNLHEQAGKVLQASSDQLQQIESADEDIAVATRKAAEVSGAAAAVAEVAGSGRDKMLAIERANAQIVSQVAVSSERVQALDKAGKQIGAIVQTIEGISEQTNLLALNAAIEAARAGEHGRGFAVVADEVRKLAEAAGMATREIANLIGQVSLNVSQTVEAIDATKPLVESGTSLSLEAVEVLSQIVQNANSAMVRTKEVSEASENLSRRMREVVKATQENVQIAEGIKTGADLVSLSIESVAAVSEETAASAEELNASSEEVSASAQELSQMADELRRQVARFKTTPDSSHLRVAA